MSNKIIPIRASSFGSFLDCAYRAEYEQLQGKSGPSSLRAHLGTSVHAGTAAFDQAKLEGQPISPDDAAGVTEQMLLQPDREVDMRDDSLSQRDAKTIALLLTAKYCTKLAPTVTYESVEMPLKPLEIDCDDGLIIKLTGTMDRARVARYTVHPMPGTNQELLIPHQTTTVITDLKTGGRLIGTDGIVSVKGRAPQVGTYQLLYEHTTGKQTGGGQIAALQTTMQAKIGLSRVFDAKAIMLGAQGEPGLIELVARMMKSGLFLPNPNSPLCSQKYCQRWRDNACRYHE